MNETSNRTAFKVLRLSTMLVIIAAAAAVPGQSPERRNNPYAPSPAGNSRPVPAPGTTGSNNEIAFASEPPARTEARVQPAKFEDSPASPSVIGSKPLPPTEKYKIGIEDILYIKLKNASTGSAYYTVRPDGTIDFPLAGEDVRVAGLTVDEIGSKLAGSIKLFADPRVDVTVREYASHNVTVSGSVSNPGMKHLRREAVPLFVIKAEAIIDPASTSVKITGEGPSPMTHDLRHPQTDNILIYPGNTVEFSIEKRRASASYFVTGNRGTAGERPLTLGLTLLKAVIAANTSSGSEPRKATIRRMNKDGKLSNLEFALKSIKAGKVADPTIEAGDIIDIRN